MSFVVTSPDLVAAAANDFAGLGSAVQTADRGAAAATGQVASAAADEVSAAIASLFSGFGREYQHISAQAAASQAQFVQTLTRASGAYAMAEAANASPLGALMGLVNAPTELLLQRPLTGNGADGVAGTGGAPVSAIPIGGAAESGLANASVLPIQSVLAQSLTGVGPAIASAEASEPPSGFSTLFNYSIPLGPFEIFREYTSFGLRLNTPFGSATLFSEGVAPFPTSGGPTGGFVYYFGNPLLYFGTLLNSSGQTGFIFDGLLLSWPGPSQFGGIIPNISFFPITF